MPVFATEIVAALVALVAAGFWGAGDFTGGLATRRGNVFAIVTVSNAVGLPLLVALALITGEPVPPALDLLWGGLAGLAGGLAVAALYAALAAGQMGIAAPITAVLAAAAPVLFGALAEGVPGGIQFAGFALAMISVWLLASPRETRTNATALRLAILAGLGIGLFLILLDQAGATALFWPLAAARVTAVALLAAITLLERRRSGAAERLPLPRIAILAGLLDVAGNTLFLLAAQLGRVDAAAVISSLYPVSTIILAGIVLKERVSMPQGIGILLALAAVVLIAW